ncbi:LEF-2 [Alphabaculovirus altermyunipunctae]|uniref:LEF-2 n=1 Tax=Mythimna unipuncta nucleopolyhedrovirus TaxID=447897 RepID=A0A346TPQ9_9ABAC|nr:LEF-2 [Mythimna unipuncta nucleopolyhedrovirus]AXU41569.1 LEF-2 [Mythimna unipuncta nucleopolyhedrovirus]
MSLSAPTRTLETQEPWIPVCQTVATSVVARETPKSSDPITWNPSLNSSLDRNQQYLIRPEDFDIEISPYTVFHHEGRYVMISGVRLQNLLNTNKKTDGLVTIHSAKARRRSSNSNFTPQHKSKSLCLVNCHNKSDFTAALHCNIRMPPCMANNLKLLSIASRGQRRNCRFVFNCYLRKTLSCGKCEGSCLLQAMYVFYEHDKKCVREVDEVFNSEYMPPNCIKMKEKYDMCSRSASCKGINPVHNF